MTHEENRIAADDLRELGKSRLHKDVQADAERLAIFDELVTACEHMHTCLAMKIRDKNDFSVGSLEKGGKVLAKAWAIK